MRLRLGLLYGRVDYVSASHATNAVTTFDGYQFGGKLDFDGWINRRFGILADATFMRAELLHNADNFRGKPINHVTWSVMPALRVFAPRETSAMGSETVVYAGPTVEYFSDVRAYSGRNFYDLSRVRLLGIKTGIRWRVAISKTWVGELGGFWVAPVTLLQKDGKGALSRSGSRSFGGVVSVEREWISGVNIGVGFNYERHGLQYKSIAPEPQAIDFTITTGLAFLRFWL